VGSSFAWAGRYAEAVEAFGSLASSACADGERKAQATGAATRNESVRKVTSLQRPSLVSPDFTKLPRTWTLSGPS